MLVSVSVVGVLLLGRPATLQSQALERSMYVTVVDRSGAPVPGLEPSDFIVREDNVAREVLRVTRATEPMQIAVMADNSTAASEEVLHIRRALPGFLDILLTPMPSGRRNEIAIISLGNRPMILADYTVEREPLDQAVSRIWEEVVPAGNYLLNGIIEVTRGFRAREAMRPVIVAIVAEGIELSDRHPDQVLGALRESGAALHVITLGRPLSDLSDESRYRDQVVDEGPRISGGTRRQLLTGSALPGALQELGNVLMNAYRVTYARPESLIPPDRITVAARRPELTAHGTPVNPSE
jgi:hypothetical protein